MAAQCSKLAPRPPSVGQVKLLLYVERNPVRAGLCREAWQWRWSSAGARCGGEDLSGLLEMASWEREMDAAKWRRLRPLPRGHCENRDMECSRE